MNTITRKWTAASLLGLALCCLTTRLVADEDEDKKQATAAAQKDILKLMGEVGSKDFVKQTEALAKKHTLEPVMIAFKPKTKGGIGIGELAKSGHKDSIELLLKDYSIKPPTKMEVTKNAEDIIKAGKVSAVIAEVAMFNTPKKRIAKKDPKDWTRLTEDMQKASADLIAAGKAKDEKAVEAAAKKLNTSCVECHAIFRDDK